MSTEENHSALEGFDSFLEDEASEGVEYIKPRYVELSLTKERKLELRAILKTLNEFGLSQRDKLFLTYIMSLEFESREAMIAIGDGVCIADQHIPKQTIKTPAAKALITNFS